VEAISDARCTPSPTGLIITHISWAGGRRAHDSVHEREVRERLKASPPHGHAGCSIATAGEKAPRRPIQCTACRRGAVSPAAWR